MILDWIIGGAQLAAGIASYKLAREQWEAQKKQLAENFKYQTEVFEAQLGSWQKERALRASNAEYLRGVARTNISLGDDDLKVALVDAIRFRARGKQAQIRGAETLRRAGIAGRAYLGEQLAAQSATGINVGTGSAQTVRAATREGFRQEAEDIAFATKEEIYASAVLASQRIHEGTRARFQRFLARKTFNVRRSINWQVGLRSQ